jgi:hypothetical protein
MRAAGVPTSRLPLAGGVYFVVIGLGLIGGADRRDSALRTLATRRIRQ